MIDSIQFASQIRAKAVVMSHTAGAAHLASALSCTDIVSVLFHSVLKLDPLSPKWEDRDRFILSKGHAATVLYAALAYKGFLTDSDLETYGRQGSLLEEHPSSKLPGVEAATGSLGHGLPCGCGMALAGRIKGQQYRTFVVMSYGECNEGSVWEAVMSAAQLGLDNLTAVVDYNKLQSDGDSRQIMDLADLAGKFKSFGWDVHEIDGHDIAQIVKAFEAPKVSGRPKILVAHTIKGKGISFMENNNEWHHNRLTKANYELALAELGTSLEGVGA